jgi:hypothetical protein
MDIANSIRLELKKDGLTQRRNGDWVLRFTVAANGMDQRLVTAAMGARYQATIDEIADDEAPIDHKAEEHGRWRDMGATRQAAMRCKEPVFWAWLTEERDWLVTDEEMAATAVRHLCDVNSRSDLDKPGYTQNRIAWNNLDNAFQAWKVREHA